jgi:chaperone required for assembly of F1-ATPase
MDILTPRLHYIRSDVLIYSIMDILTPRLHYIRSDVLIYSIMDLLTPRLHYIRSDVLIYSITGPSSLAYVTGLKNWKNISTRKQENACKDII